MGASNIALDSVLASPKSGMDLVKGVPEKFGDKTESKSTDFDRVLSRQNEAHEERVASKATESKSADAKATEAKAPAPQAKSEMKHAKTCAHRKATTPPKADAVNLKEEEVKVSEPSEILQLLAQGLSESPNEPKPDESDAKEGAEPAQVVLQNQDILQIQVQQLQESEKTPSAQDLPPAQQFLSVASTSDLLQKLGVKLTAAKTNENINPTSNQSRTVASVQTQAPVLPTNTEKKDASLENSLEFSEQASQQASSTKSNESALSLSRDFNSKDDKADFAGLMQKSEKSEAAGKSLKQMVDSLYVQQTLEMQSTDANSSVQAPKLQASDLHATPEILKSNLVHDIQPVIHQMAMKDQGGEMTVSLRPAHMGWVKVNVLVDDGAVKVALQTENPQAKSMLESQLKDLHQSLSQSGLKVEDVSVAMSPAGASNHSSEMGDRQNPQNPQGDSEPSRRNPNEQRQPASQQRHKEELFAEMMKERNAA